MLEAEEPEASVATVARAGLILVTINPAYRLSEVEYTINKVGLSALVAASRFKTSYYPAMIEELAPEVAASTPASRSPGTIGTNSGAVAISVSSPSRAWPTTNNS